MASIPNIELERLKREVSMVRLVEDAGIELKRHGITGAGVKIWGSQVPGITGAGVKI